MQEYEEFNFINIDWSFGLKDILPGAGDLAAPNGGPELFKGFVHGANVPNNTFTDECDRYIQKEFNTNLYKADNISATIGTLGFTNEATFAFFDLLLTYTKLSTFLHPIAFNCWNSYEHTYEHFYHQIVVHNKDDFKTYLMNVVYNFGHLFDSMRDFVSFLTNDPRGDITNVYDAGYSLGQFVYYLITPNTAEYES